MKASFFIFLNFFCVRLIAQVDSSDRSSHNSNSFETIYSRSNPELKYVYQSLTQTHDYSGNWDLDGDKKPDSVYFIGNGGAHLYFYLKIITSSDNKMYTFPYLLIDFPMLGSIDSLEQHNGEFMALPQFVVSDFNNDNKRELYIRLDPFTPLPSRLKKNGVTSKSILICYKGGKFIIRNYK